MAPGPASSPRCQYPVEPTERRHREQSEGKRCHQAQVAGVWVRLLERAIGAVYAVAQGRDGEVFGPLSAQPELPDADTRLKESDEEQRAQ